jgi:endonuclease III
MTPKHVPVVYRILQRRYDEGKAPIVDFVQVQTKDPFKVLVTTILSARTKDDTTADAALRLFEEVQTPTDLRRLSVERIERLIFPVGFYHTKARHLKALPDALDARFGGRVPDTLEDLCELPGVGRKTANLVLGQAFGKAAICVDVHVHRISNRLGLVRTETPYETEMALSDVLPARYWRLWNSFLVSHGQTICSPISPRCSVCPIHAYCDRVGVARAR